MVDCVKGRRQVEADQHSDLLVVSRREDSASTSSSAVSVECPFLYADWSSLKLPMILRARSRRDTGIRTFWQEVV